MAVPPEKVLACPYFVPRAIVNDGSWLHPSRLPLGAGWTGDCCASGTETLADDVAIHQYCNLGNATLCPQLPTDRDWDAIRFSVAGTSHDQITLWYVCERSHAPAAFGNLIFDRVVESWMNPHPDGRVQRLADCYLETYRARANESVV